jgi:Fe-S cluster biosynthesis and repair protein YggX
MATVNCNVCGTEAESLAQAPMGGAIGDRIMTSVCKDCWAAWLDQQARVINHYGLQLAYPDDRKQLMGYMKEFLKLETP